jgi:endonuclease/exonuclease/phosphatase (EEP) superfamily protein YafD
LSPARPPARSARAWPRARLIVVLLSAIAATALLALPVAAQAKAPKVKVMTRNLYLGANLLPALGSSSSAELVEKAGDVWRAVQETNFPARAKVLADEVAKNKPELIGLQEAALWRREAGPPDFDESGGAPPDATEVVYDFLDSLKHEIDRRGIHYRVASKQQEADFETPLDFTHDSTFNPTYDGRLTIFDVVLARRGLNTKNPQHENFAQGAPVDLPPHQGCPPTCGPEDITIKRGWASIDVVKKHRKFRFVDTHLEQFSAAVRNIQASELNSPTGPLNFGKPVILVGDLNSDPAGASPDAYNTFTGNGFKDRGAGVNTCCHDDLLLDDSNLFEERIDHILTKPGLQKLNAVLTGDDPALQTPFGLWPSDHGGVVSKLRLK